MFPEGVDRECPPSFFEERFCPWHGELIRLADCPVVATNETQANEVRKRLRRSPASSRLAGPLQDDDDAVLGDPSRSGDDRQHINSPPSRPAQGRVARSVEALRVGDELESAIDGVQRLVVALPPTRPTTSAKRLLRADPQPRLPTAAELAEQLGGARLRPVRACPNLACLHPLPAAVDTRDVFVLAVVGNTGASKTTLLAALADRASSPEGRRELGLADFAVTEDSSKRFKAILRGYRDGESTIGTDTQSFGYLEANISFADQSLPSGVLVLHNLGGENYQDLDLRMHHAAHVLWSDAIVFVVNPEETPRMNTAVSDVAQADVLSGLRDDLSSFDRPVPPLFCALSKGDLLPEARTLGRGRMKDEEALSLFNSLGAADVVAAANRWPSVEWHLVAPQPVSGQPFGVLELFQGVLAAIAKSGR